MADSFWGKAPIAVAHRGGAGAYSIDRYKYENTIKTFHKAVGLGYKYLELDVLLTADSQVVVLHVTTDKVEALLHKPSAPNAANLQKLTYEQLKVRLDRDVPTLEQILKSFPRHKFLIDPKTDAVVEPLAEVIKKNKAGARTGLNSFYLHRVAGLRQLLGDKVGYGLIIGRYPRIFNRKLWNLARGGYKDAGLTYIVFPDRFLSHSLVDVIHSQGFRALVWAPNTRRKIEQAIQSGIDGIISDNAKLLIEMLPKGK